MPAAGAADREAGAGDEHPTDRLRLVLGLMGLDDYKVVLYRNQPDGWVAEVPAIPGCHALMPTREEALAELAEVFKVVADEYREAGRSLPADTTEIVHA
jgi:predicted RNase H-like HicB family nuclease